MSTPLLFKLTAAGQAAAWNASNTGLQVAITHVQLGSAPRPPSGQETALTTPAQVSQIAAGSRVSPSQIRLSAMFSGAQTYPIHEIGLWAGEPGTSGAVLFAYYAQVTPIAHKSPGVDFIFTHDMALADAVASGSVTITTDPAASAMLALLEAHQQATDPHAAAGYVKQQHIDSSLAAHQQPDASETVKGIVELATIAEAAVGTDTVRAVTPAGVAAARDKDLRTVGASVAANALTVTLAPARIDFRSNSLTNGAINTRSIASAISLTISSGSTLGTINGVASRIAILAIDNNGTVELAAVNMAGGVNLDETTLINTTAEGGAGAADSANVIYATTARTNVPFRVVGFIDITQATAGTWATAPTRIQGYGGQAMAAMQSIGYGQTWQNMAGSRAIGTTYYNTTGKPIIVAVSGISSSGANWATLTVNGVALSGTQCQSLVNQSISISAVIPHGGSYVVTLQGGSLSAVVWGELR